MDPSESVLPPNLFAEYRRAQDDPRVRPSGLAKCASLCPIAIPRESAGNGRRKPAVVRQSIQRDLTNIGNVQDSLWLTAEVGEARRIWQGFYAKLQPMHRRMPPEDATGGVTVDPAFRRLGTRTS
jgi:hypothetical protein